MGVCSSNRAESSWRIQALRFPLACLVVWIHAHEPAIQFSSGPAPLILPWGCRWLLETVFNDMARVAVPLYFIFSGYLLFLRSGEGGWRWREAVAQRLARMVGPYLFWNSLFLTVMSVGRWVPGVQKYFSGRSPAMGDQTVQGFVDQWLGITGHPADVPLWYLRDLACLLIVSGLIAAVLRWLRGPRVLVYFAAVIGLDFALHRFHTRLPSDLFWFSCGCWCGLQGGIPELVGASRLMVTAAWLGLSVWRGYGLLTDWMWRSAWLTVPLGVWVVWSWSGELQRYPRLRAECQRLAAASFFLFAAHVLPLVALRKLTWHWFERGGPWVVILGLYGLIPGLVLLVCLRAQPWTLRLPWSWQKWLDPTARPSDTALHRY
jgi:Acyltransferase family